MAIHRLGGYPPGRKSVSYAIVYGIKEKRADVASLRQASWCPRFGQPAGRNLFSYQFGSLTPKRQLVNAQSSRAGASCKPPACSDLALILCDFRGIASIVEQRLERRSARKANCRHAGALNCGLRCPLPFPLRLLG